MGSDFEFTGVSLARELFRRRIFRYRNNRIDWGSCQIDGGGKQTSPEPCGYRACIGVNLRFIIAATVSRHHFELVEEMFAHFGHLGRNDNLAVGLAAIACIVVLVIIFSRVELIQARHLSHNGAAP